MNKLEFILIFLLVILSGGLWSQDKLEFVCYSKTQQCGVRSPEGDTIIPFKFQNISRIAFDYYIAHRRIDGLGKETFKMSIYDLNGKKVLPDEYDWVSADLKYNCIYFHKDGSTGILDLATQQSYNRIGVYGINSIQLSSETSEHDRLIILSSEKGSEVLNSQFNTLFSTEKYIYSGSANSSSRFSQDSMIYRFGDLYSGKTGYLNASGKVIVPDDYTDYFWAPDHFSNFGDNKCFIATDGKKYDFYSEIGAEPLTGFQYLHFSDHYLTAKRGTKWMLLDEQLKPVFTDSKYGLSFLSGQFDPIEFNYEDMFTEGSEFFTSHLISSLSPEYNFIYQIEFCEPIKDCDAWSRNCIKKQGKVGLSNVNSKQSIPVAYDYLLPFRYINWFSKSHNFQQTAPNYFWAIKSSKAKGKLELTIYNDQLENEKSYTLNELSLDFLRRDIRNQGDTTTRILVNENGLYGMIRADGSIKVPFIYERLSYRRTNQHNHVEHLYFGNATHYGLFDAQGNMLLPVIYDTIYYPNNNHFNLILAKKGNTFTYYLNETSEQIAGISHIFEAEYIRKPNKQDHYYSGKASYFIKNGFLYVIDQSEAVLMDKERVYMKLQEIELFNRRILIDQSGKVLKNEMR